MVKSLYCWRCMTDIPMLDEHEWEQVMPELQRGVQQMKAYRAEHDSSLIGAKQHIYGHGPLVEA